MGDVQVIGTPPPSGELLKTVVYAPASDTEVAASTSYADVDATNLAITFTAPASGKVMVTLSANGELFTSSSVLYWNLRDGSGDIAGTGGRVVSSFATLQSLTARRYVSGLTPGTSYTYKWGHARITDGKTEYGPGTGVHAPAIMTVHEGGV